MGLGFVVVNDPLGQAHTYISTQVPGAHSSLWFHSHDTGVGVGAEGIEGADGAGGAEGAEGAAGGGGKHAPRLQGCDAVGFTQAHLLSDSIFPSLRIQFTVAV